MAQEMAQTETISRRNSTLMKSLFLSVSDQVRREIVMKGLFNRLHDPKFCQDPQNIDLCEYLYESMEADVRELMDKGLPTEGQ